MLQNILYKCIIIEPTASLAI